MRTDVVAAGDLRALVPADAQPVQVVDDVAFVLHRAAGGVGVLDAQHVGAAGMTRGEEVVEARARGADVERTGRAWRHPHAHGSVHTSMLAAVRWGRHRTRVNLSSPHPHLETRAWRPT